MAKKHRNDDGVNSGRRKFIKAVGGTSLAASTGIGSYYLTDKGSASYVDFDGYVQDKIDAHGDIVRVDSGVGGATTSSFVSSSTVTNYQSNFTVEPDCIPAPDGNCYTEAPTPTPTPTPDPTPNPTPVPNDGPSAQITQAPSTGFTFQQIDFIGDGSDSDGYISDYYWNFGDGNTGYGSSATNVYSSPGEYTVQFKVTDNDGATDWAYHTIQISESPYVTETAVFEDGYELTYNIRNTDVDEIFIEAPNQNFREFLDQATCDTQNGLKQQLDTNIDVLRNTCPTPSQTPVEIPIGSDHVFDWTDFVDGRTDWHFLFESEQPIPFAEAAFADWHSGGRIEAHTVVTVAGTAFAAAETFVEFKLTGDNSVSPHFKFDYEYNAKLFTAICSSAFDIEIFVRDVSDPDNPQILQNYSPVNESATLTAWGVSELELGLLDPTTDWILEKTFSNSSAQEVATVDEPITPGNTIQAGMRIISRAQAIVDWNWPGKSASDIANMTSPNPNSDGIHYGSDSDDQYVQIDQLKIDFYPHDS